MKSKIINRIRERQSMVVRKELVRLTDQIERESAKEQETMRASLKHKYSEFLAGAIVNNEKSIRDLDAQYIIPSYHDVEVSYAGKRFRPFDVSESVRLVCSRCGGWELWSTWGGVEKLLAGEYHETKLSVFVRGVQIC